MSVSELRDYIDWTPFFQSWELKGTYPTILEDPAVGEHAVSLLDDARSLLDRLEGEDILQPKALVGLFAANAVGDDVELYVDPARSEVAAVMWGLRQQFAKGGRENLCLSDFIAPKSTKIPDWAGAFAVTVGEGVEGLVRECESAHDDYSAILATAVADRLAEALAEYAHERVRRDLWGYAAHEKLGNTDLISESYQGIRPAPGYPACPDHSEKRTIFRLLDAEKALGIRLTESCAMDPPASVSGWYLAHPAAHYFGIGRLGRDQVADYAQRKSISVGEAETWLAQSLAYEPGGAP